jgi:hypothetical protein
MLQNPNRQVKGGGGDGNQYRPVKVLGPTVDHHVKYDTPPPTPRLHNTAQTFYSIESGGNGGGEALKLS